MIKERIIDGKKISQKILTNLKTKIDQDKKKNSVFSVKLAIIVVGDNQASNIYIKNKIKAADAVGIEIILRKYSEYTPEMHLLKHIDYLNHEQQVSGIIVQLPLPSNFDKTKIINSIIPAKDVDGLHPMNMGLLYSSYRHKFVSCTAMGCLELIKSCCSILTGKHVVIIGRSNIVGRPLGALLLKQDCSVTICHSKTTNLQLITRQADIVISAVGVPGFLKKNNFNSNAIVIDVGISRVKLENKYVLMGDVDFEDVKQNVQYITPVPGGVGPMTVAYLLVNTYISAKAKFLSSHNANKH